jgi:hypothetical protein
MMIKERVFCCCYSQDPKKNQEQKMFQKNFVQVRTVFVFASCYNKDLATTTLFNNNMPKNINSP